MNQKEFNDYIKISFNKPIFIFIYADWCKICKLVKPIYEKVKIHYLNKNIEFYDFNSDNKPKLAQEFQAYYLPYIVIIKNGQILYKIKSNSQYKEFIKIIDKALET